MGTESAAKRALKQPLARAQGLSKRYALRRRSASSAQAVDALADVDLEIQPQCLTALVGGPFFIWLLRRRAG